MTPVAIMASSSVRALAVFSRKKTPGSVIEREMTVRAAMWITASTLWAQEDLLHHRPVADVAHDEHGAGEDGVAVPLAEVVDDDDPRPRFEQAFDDDAADVAPHRR